MWSISGADKLSNELLSLSRNSLLLLEERFCITPTRISKPEMDKQKCTSAVSAIHKYSANALTNGALPLSDL
jgi:hypothetical protein